MGQSKLLQSQEYTLLLIGVTVVGTLFDDLTLYLLGHDIADKILALYLLQHPPYNNHNYNCHHNHNHNYNYNYNLNYMFNQNMNSLLNLQTTLLQNKGPIE
jgi:hypothetical protein